MINLYRLFYYVRDFRTSPAVNISEIIERLTPYVGCSLPPCLKSNQAKIIIGLMYLRAKRNLVEKDLLSFQKEAFVVNSKL